MDPSEARHIVGIDVGTTNVRVHVAHYRKHRSAHSEPALVHLPGSERDGALPSVLEIGSGGALRSFGVPALMSRTRHEPHLLVSEFKPCIGQSPNDLSAQGRPETVRYCSNPNCIRPGPSWSTAQSVCTYCGSPLETASGADERWRPTFRYTQEEALGYAEILLVQIGHRLQAQFGEELDAQSGWLVTAGVPVHWQDETRAFYEERLRIAFPKAAINLEYEPAGALRYYGMRNMLQAGGDLRWTLVVDFGGGTTDLVLAHVEPTERSWRISDVRSYGERYGGTDFDLLLARHAASELGVTLDGPLLAQWKIQAREWKEAFSARVHQDKQLRSLHDAIDITSGVEEDTAVTVSFAVPRDSSLFEYAPVTLHRSAFALAAGDLVERFSNVLERGLNYFGVDHSDIEQVVLTGGGAHWYFVNETVERCIPGARLLSGIEPEMSISKGLALTSTPPVTGPPGGVPVFRWAPASRTPTALTTQSTAEGLEPDFSTPVGAVSTPAAAEVIAPDASREPGELQAPTRVERAFALPLMEPDELLLTASPYDVDETAAKELTDGEAESAEPDTAARHGLSLMAMASLPKEAPADDVEKDTEGSPFLLSWDDPPGAPHPWMPGDGPYLDPIEPPIVPEFAPEYALDPVDPPQAEPPVVHAGSSFLTWLLIIAILFISGVFYLMETKSGLQPAAVVAPAAPLSGAAQVIPGPNVTTRPAAAEQMVTVTICKESGLLATKFCPHTETITEPASKAPTKYCKIHYEPTCPICGRHWSIASGVKYCPFEVKRVKLTGIP